MTVEFSTLHKILKDHTRRDILRCLNDKGTLSYVELMGLAEVTNTGRFNYHLKVLNGLIEKQGDGRYGLTERGRLAVKLLDEFPERTTQTRGPKIKSKKLVITAVILLVGIIAISSLLISMQHAQSISNKKVNMEIDLHYYNDYNSTAISFTCLLFNPTSNTLYNCIVNILYVNTANQTAQTTIPEGNVSAQPSFNSPQQISFVVNNFYMTAGHLDESEYIKLSAYGYSKP